MLFSGEKAVHFSRGGDGERALLHGWSIPEDLGCWSDGPEASLLIEHPKTQFGLVLEMALKPALFPPIRSSQVVIISCNSVVVATLTVDRSGIFGVFLPPQNLQGARSLIRFHFPTTLRPAELSNVFDRRQLAINVQYIRLRVLYSPWRLQLGQIFNSRITAYQNSAIIEQASDMLGCPLFEALHDFEVIGGNCDMGLALRSLGYESLSFLRFGGASPAAAIQGLETEFAGLGEHLSLEIADNPLLEWMVSDKIGLRFHSGLSSDTVTEENVRKRFPLFIRRLRDKFLEDLRDGTKVFVFSDHKDVSATRTVEYIMPLYMAFRKKTKSPLLWVCPALNDPSQRGAVREILPGLYMGHLDLFAPPVLIGGGISVAGWINIICNTYIATKSIGARP